MNKDTEKELSMTSQQWQQLIDNVTAEIAMKAARLDALVNAKAAAILEPKKLVTLEAEEAAIPALIEQLRKRLPLLTRELEGALRAEAEMRVSELAPQIVEAAKQVSKSTREIRAAISALLECVTAAHEVWQAEASLVGEANFLCARFTLPALQIAAGNRLTPEEKHDCTRTFELQLRRSVNTHPWEGMLSDFQAQRRSEEQKRQAREDAARPNIIPYLVDWIDGKPFGRRRI